MREPRIISTTSDEALIVEYIADGSVGIHVRHANLHVPRHLIMPLLSGLVYFDDDIPLPGEDGHHRRVTDELALDLQADASIVIAIGSDDLPADTIEVPGVQIEKLTQTLRALLRRD